MRVTYWSDFVCPFCYIGVERLKKAAEKLGIDLELELKAFQLDPSATNHATSTTVERFAQKYGLSIDEAAHRIDLISEMGKSEGINFKYATTLFTNTMDAHRLTKLGFARGGLEISEKLAEKFYAAYFTENLELADHSLLKKIGIECGLDAEEIDQLLASNKYRDEVILDEREAMRYGIHAVPFFIVEGKYTISGADSVENISEILRKARLESPAQSSNGFHCGEDGCNF